jgi:hypothetical protein
MNCSEEISSLDKPEIKKHWLEVIPGQRIAKIARLHCQSLISSISTLGEF